jgi:hypothetical protein
MVERLLSERAQDADPLHTVPTPERHALVDYLLRQHAPSNPAVLRSSANATSPARAPGSLLSPPSSNGSSAGGTGSRPQAQQHQRRTPPQREPSHHHKPREASWERGPPSPPALGSPLPVNAPRAAPPWQPHICGAVEVDNALLQEESSRADSGQHQRVSRAGDASPTSTAAQSLHFACDILPPRATPGMQADRSKATTGSLGARDLCTDTLTAWRTQANKAVQPDVSGQHLPPASSQRRGAEIQSLLDANAATMCSGTEAGRLGPGRQRISTPDPDALAQSIRHKRVR